MREKSATFTGSTTRFEGRWLRYNDRVPRPYRTTIFCLVVSIGSTVVALVTQKTGWGAIALSAWITSLAMALRLWNYQRRLRRSERALSGRSSKSDRREA